MKFTFVNGPAMRGRLTFDCQPAHTPHGSAALCIDSLERIVAEESRVHLDDAFIDRPSLGAWGERERAAQRLRELNKKNADFWKNGGSAA